MMMIPFGKLAKDRVTLRRNIYTFLLSLFIPTLRTKGSGSQLDQLTLCTISKHRLIESNGQELEIILWTLFVCLVLRLKSSVSEKHIYNSELKFFCFKIKI